MAPELVPVPLLAARLHQIPGNRHKSRLPAADDGQIVGVAHRLVQQVEPVGILPGRIGPPGPLPGGLRLGLAVPVHYEADRPVPLRGRSEAAGETGSPLRHCIRVARARGQPAQTHPMPVGRRGRVPAEERIRLPDWIGQHRGGSERPQRPPVLLQGEHAGPRPVREPEDGHAVGGRVLEVGGNAEWGLGPDAGSRKQHQGHRQYPPSCSTAIGCHSPGISPFLGLATIPPVNRKREAPTDPGARDRSSSRADSPTDRKSLFGQFGHTLVTDRERDALYFRLDENRIVATVDVKNTAKPDLSLKLDARVDMKAVTNRIIRSMQNLRGLFFHSAAGSMKVDDP